MSLNGKSVDIMKRRERFASRELLFTELLDGSGDNMEGQHQQKHRWGLQHYAFLDGSTQMLDMDDSLHLPDQMAEYNRKKSEEFHLLLCKVLKYLHWGRLRTKFRYKGAFGAFAGLVDEFILCSHG